MKNVDSLVKNILKIKTTDHLQIQWQIRKMLQDLGFETKIEEKLLFGDEKRRTNRTQTINSKQSLQRRISKIKK